MDFYFMNLSRLPLTPCKLFVSMFHILTACSSVSFLKLLHWRCSFPIHPLITLLITLLLSCPCS